MGLRLGLIGFFAICGAANAVAPLAVPKLNEPFFKSCFRQDLNADMPSKAWTLTCPLTDFLQHAEKVANPSPAFRLLVGHLVHDEINRLRAETFLSTRPVTKDEANSAFNPLAMTHQAARTESDFENPTGVLLAQTEDMVAQAKKWLEPLFKSSPLSTEAGLCYFQILGDSLRFSSAQEMLVDQPFFLQAKWARVQVLQNVSVWIDAYGAPRLRDWLRKRLEELRPDEITGAKSDDLFYWIRSLELAPELKTKSARAFVLGKLRELSVAYPAVGDEKKIKALAERLFVGRTFTPVVATEMNPKELMIRAQALVRNLETNEALKTIHEILNRPKRAIKIESLWAALQLNVRILRILDQRHEIGKLIENYLQIRNFLSYTAKTPDLSKVLERAYETAKMYWTYADPEKALAAADRIIEVSRRAKNDRWMGQALYLKARISEQLPNKVDALPLFDRAIASKLNPDLLSDLIWRRLFIYFDVAAQSKDFSKLPNYLQEIKIPADDPSERARLALLERESPTS